MELSPISLFLKDSIPVSAIGVISRQDLAALPANDMGLMALGMFEYCDDIGTHSVRNFGLRYRSNAPSGSLSFDLAQDTPVPIRPLAKPAETVEYIPPCETPTEREQNQKKTTKP